MISKHKLFIGLLEIKDVLDSYADYTHEELFTQFLQEKLSSTLDYYNTKLAISEEYLTQVPAEKLLKEIAFQQKRAIKIQRAQTSEDTTEEYQEESPGKEL